MSFYRLELLAKDPLLLGTGRGAGYSTSTAGAIPASTLLGAIAAAFQRSGQHARSLAQTMAGASASDAVLSPPLALDRLVCKYPDKHCPPSYPWDHVGPCPRCNGNLERSKAEPDAPRSVRTRVALDARGRAIPEKLFARESLDVRGHTLTAYFAGDPEALGLQPRAQLRVGAERSVGGRVTITEVARQEPLQITASKLRLEMLSPGVFVDDFGLPSDRPSPQLLKAALGVKATVDRAFVRWSTIGGWARLPNRPKPADPGVITGSVFHLTLESAGAVPTLGANLGVRGCEGCGWFRVSKLDGPAELQASGNPEVSA